MIISCKVFSTVSILLKLISLANFLILQKVKAQNAFQIYPNTCFEQSETKFEDRTLCGLNFDVAKNDQQQQQQQKLSYQKCIELPGCCWYDNQCFLEENIPSVKKFQILMNLIQSTGVKKFDDPESSGKVTKSRLNINWFSKKYGSDSNSVFKNFEITRKIEGYLEKMPQCPVKDENLPHCQRTPCMGVSGDMVAQKKLDQDVFLCYQQIGCCFDMDLYMYKKSFGYSQKQESSGLETPVCYQAVFSPVYLDLTSNSNSINLWDANNVQKYTSRFQILSDMQETVWAEKNQCGHANPGELLNSFFQRYAATQQYNNYIFDFFRTYTRSETLLKVAYTLLDVLSPSCADGTQSSKNANNNSSNVADISVMNCHLLNCCHLEYINFRGNKVQRCVQAVNSEFWVDDMEFGKSFETVMDIVISQQQKKIILPTRQRNNEETCSKDDKSGISF